MTQNEQVLQHLLSNDHLSHLQAIGVYGIYRLAGRIYDLNKRLPWPLCIHTEMTTDARGKRYARYRLGMDETPANATVPAVRPLKPSEKRAEAVVIGGLYFPHWELLECANPRRVKEAA